jgi:hypothetical protein
LNPFDEDNPPETFDGFVQSVKKTIEEADVQADEIYPDALFTVDKYHIGRVMDIDEIAIHLGVNNQVIINTKCVNHIRCDDVKWYACATWVTDEVDQYMVLIFGDKLQTGVSIAEIFIDGDYQYIKDWEKLDPRESFEHIVIPLRKSIVNQG